MEFTDEFESWWDSLNEAEQIELEAAISVLEERGPVLQMPLSSGIVTSKHGHMRELRVQVKGRPYRVLYAFDPLRVAILLIGGDKTGDNRWYERYVPIADRIYDEHIETLKREEKIPR